jgi:hypothetical protein
VAIRRGVAVLDTAVGVVAAICAGTSLLTVEKVAEGAYWIIAGVSSAAVSTIYARRGRRLLPELSL